MPKFTLMILSTDFIHHETNDGTCSRCRRQIEEGEVPIMLWPDNSSDMLIYCDDCEKGLWVDTPVLSEGAT
jgi:hypothetical protein